MGALGVTRKALSDLLNGHNGVSPDMAIRLGWSTADHWLRMQLQRKLWEARQLADKIKVRKHLGTEPAPAQCVLIRCCAAAASQRKPQAASASLSHSISLARTPPLDHT